VLTFIDYENIISDRIILIEFWSADPKTKQN